MAKNYSHAKVKGTCLFTTNSKTGCPSWAISPKSCTGAKGCSVCKKCYGKKGRFNMPSVKNSLNQRFNWFEKSSVDEVIQTLVDEINHFGESFFRAHVVGDFKNIRSIEIWTAIAKKLPKVRFWFPTKAYRVSEMMPSLVKLNKLKNVVVRPSSENFDDPAPKIKGLSAGATAYKDEDIKPNHFDCPGECEGCRVCWDKTGQVGYHYH